ncbi:MAG: sulfatase [Thermoanaerobaculia bacterium]|nr:sulfatase [Thermoanaerobaculia bacterium]
MLLRFGEPRDLELHLHGWPFTFEGSPPQTVTITLAPIQGRVVNLGRLDLQPHPTSYMLSIPAKHVEPGTQVLTLRYGYHFEPREVMDSDDARSLGVGWSRIRIVGQEGATPRIDDRGLVLPKGSVASRHLHIEPRSQLLLESVSLERQGRLHVQWRASGAVPKEIATIEMSGDHVVSLPTDDPTLARIRLRASGGDAHIARAGIRATVMEDEQTSAALDPIASDPPRLDPPHIVLLVVDTLRRDALGVYRTDGASVTPHLDRFADRSYVFDDAVASASWTRPAVASIFTGREPLRHGVTRLDSVLADDAHTLAEMLSAAGYWTAGHTTNAHLVAERGFAQGFDRYRYEPYDADQMVGVAADLLDSAPQDRPVFLYLHLLEPHAPFEPRADLRQLHAPGVDAGIGTLRHLRDLGSHRTEATTEVVSGLIQLYEAEVAWIDEFFGKLLTQLRERGLFEETAIAVASDHGEAFGEHDVFGHGWDLHSEAVRIPLLLRLPGQIEGARLERLATLSDLMPMLLHLAAGNVRLPDAGLPEESSDRNRFIHLAYEGRDAIAVLTPRYKLILPLSQDYGRRPELYDRLLDPGETVDLMLTRPVIAGYLQEVANRELAATPEETESRPLDEGTRRALEALGYLDTGS